MAFRKRNKWAFSRRLMLVLPFLWFSVALWVMFATKPDFRSNLNWHWQRNYGARREAISNNKGHDPEAEYFYRQELAVVGGDDIQPINHQQEIDAELKLPFDEEGAGDFENGVDHKIDQLRLTLVEPEAGQVKGQTKDGVMLLADVAAVDLEDKEFDKNKTEVSKKNEEDFKRSTEVFINTDEIKYMTLMDRTRRMEYSNVTWPPVPLKGLGEGGLSVKLMPRNSAEKTEKERGLAIHYFNQFVSDRISVRRNITDHRIPECRTLTYREDLPDTSVVIIFHNEAWTTLLRTVYSVLDRTPAHLLREIILVDDYSDFQFLKLPLEVYMSQFDKVKVVHTTQREGLIRARLLGIQLATGETLTFLDSHCECNIGWLEPLLDRIAEDWSHVVTPIIDSINTETFGYHSARRTSFAIGTFTWNMYFKWGWLDSREKSRRKSPTSPARSPTMAGGLFAINRKYFHHIGLYDPGMEIWGGENVELSFRIWLCGGTLEVVPCSRVGHVFRKINPNFSGIKGFPQRRNTLRLVETWLDDYKYFFYQTIGYYTKVDYGDISGRLQLKKRLQCKPFGWYMKNVVPEMFDPKQAVRSGLLQNAVRINNHTYKCLAHQELVKMPYKGSLTIKTCQDKNPQIFYLTKDGMLRQLDYCLSYVQRNKELIFLSCPKKASKNSWGFTETNQIRHNTLGVCLTMSSDGRSVTTEQCQGRDEQKWEWIDFQRVHR